MQICKLIDSSFLQLEKVLLDLDAEQYVQRCQVLSEGTIGQHVRHIIELFQCLMTGYESGCVNYDNRERNKQIETDRNFAISLLHKIVNSLEKPNRQLTILSEVFETGDDIMHSNYCRELAYNLEHTIHHMALIKPAVYEVARLPVSDQFGVAPSTIKYRETCAQ